MPKKLPLILIVGPSCSGKTTLLSQALPLLDSPLRELRACTTRPPREGEDGHYDFIEHDDFFAAVAVGNFLEYDEYCNNWYGTRFSEVSPNRLPAVKIVTLPGIEKFRKGLERRHLDVPLKTILVRSDPASIRRRLADRGEPEAVVEARLNDINKFEGLSKQFDATIVNRDGGANRAAKRLAKILQKMIQGDQSP
jgi:guanylate kinase